MKATHVIFLIGIAFSFVYCESDPEGSGIDLTHIGYEPKSYPLVIPKSLPPLPDFPDNPMTYDGVQLGRHLFYDNILSSDSTLSCASCHNPRLAFTDGGAMSRGVNGQLGARSSMTILNVAYNQRGFFWDGRASTLEDQATRPVEDPVEMHEQWPNVEKKLQRHTNYQILFRKAFGISNTSQITKDLAVKAISQFERILITGGNSLYHREGRGEIFFDEDQQSGKDMFFDLVVDAKRAECNHCHSAPLFTADNYFNNGLDSAATLEDFKDLGRGKVTNFRPDNGKFKAPSLLNIALTGPYMHDGRFSTLEEVIEHYNSGGHPADNKDVFVLPLKLRTDEKRALLAFLHTLTDTSYLKNPDVLSPF